MNYYMAPLEGMTGYLFRQVYRELFGDADKYFTPFLSPTEKKLLKSRERREVAPENNAGQNLVPQILTNHPQAFLDLCGFLRDLGYREIDLNLGCPSGTVVSRQRGAGFLADPDRLDRFFEQVFDGLADSDLRISVKTRIGMTDPEEWPALLAIYNRYPLSEVIVHPRLRKDFYRNTPDLEAFALAYEESAHPLCYNGDIWMAADHEALLARFPKLECVMLGRGLLGNPGLIHELRTGEPVTKEQLYRYQDLLFETYSSRAGGDRVALYKMKEVWMYMSPLFSGSAKAMKKLRKANDRGSYQAAVDEMFRLELDRAGRFYSN